MARCFASGASWKNPAGPRRRTRQEAEKAGRPCLFSKAFRCLASVLVWWLGLSLLPLSQQPPPPPLSFLLRLLPPPSPAPHPPRQLLPDESDDSKCSISPARSCP